MSRRRFHAALAERQSSSACVKRRVSVSWQKSGVATSIGWLHPAVINNEAPQIIVASFINQLPKFSERFGVGGALLCGGGGDFTSQHRAPLAPLVSTVEPKRQRPQSKNCGDSCR